MDTTILQKLTQSKYYNGIITLVATVAMSGSLYFSEILHLYPCKLCWFQRILIYPIVAVGVYSILTKQNLYGLVGFLSGTALLVSGYHSIIQRTGDGVCSGTCSVIQYTVGPLSIPNLALIASILLFTTTVISYWVSSD
jgi:disulfide bond formation protein DsbB